MAKRKTFLLRISPELYGVLEKWAADELRSVNAQIEFLLMGPFAKPGATTGPKRNSIPGS